MLTDPLETYSLLFDNLKNCDKQSLLKTRDQVADVVRKALTSSLQDVSRMPGVNDQKNVHLPILQYVAHLLDSRSIIFIGIIGSPGSGKSTIASYWAIALKLGFGLDVLMLSSDDFYLPKSERVSRGYTWRGSPETHDISLFRDTIQNIYQGKFPLVVPRFDPKLDDRGAPDLIEVKPRVCILEGWMIGKLAEMACGSIRPFFDFLAYLNMSDIGAKHARFKRESMIYKESRGEMGFSPDEMSSFWLNSLKPNIDNFVKPYLNLSDLILELGPGHRICSIAKPVCSGAITNITRTYREK